MPLLKRAAPFDNPDWIFELKYDGFRALAVTEDRPRSTDLSQRASVRLMFGTLSGRA
jgi:ATP-dependent DNA ligase